MTLPASPAFVLALSLVSAPLLAQVQALDDGWRFHRGDAAGAESRHFDDAGWRTVDLPHDFGIEPPLSPAADSPPQDPKVPEGSDVGYLHGGVGWYRLHLDGQALRAAGAELVIDGAQQDADLWVNGEHVAFQPHGYIPLCVEIGHLLDPTSENVIAIRTLNPEQNSRWYPGSGLYRSVELRTHGPIHIPTWGARVETIRLHGPAARLRLRASVRNDDRVGRDLAVACRITDPSGSVRDHPLGTVRVAGGATETLQATIDLDAAEAWSPESPRLYLAEFAVQEGAVVVDTLSSRFGVRTLEVNAGEGFILNGRPLKLRGACLHHDNGLLGAAAFPAAEERRVRLMKENGFNAIRTSHNPPSTAFLNACDRLGVLVVDEFTDTWELPKRRNGYQRHFDAHWSHDLGAMIDRDFNHPSVVMWSIGNEIPERFTKAGVEIERQLVEFVHAADPGRPVTSALPYIYEYPEISEHWKSQYPALSLLDVGGYNYSWREYGADHQQAPHWVMMQTESYPREAFEIWRETNRLSYVLGDFVWTGLDYLGESGIGHSTYIEAGADPATTGQSDWEHMPWPWWIAWCGDLDLTGVKKPQSYYRDVVWGRTPVEIMVHEPVPDGKREKVGPWGWRNELPQWNWPIRGGAPLEVSVYSHGPHVSLLLNGRSAGEADLDPERSITATFNVPYEPGTLVAVVRDGTRELGRRTLATTGAPAALRATPESVTAPANRAAVVFVPIAVVDHAGAVVPDASVPITCRVTGEAELQALGTGNPTDIEPLTDPQTTTFRGRALLVLRSSGRPGRASVTVSAAGLPEVSSAVEFTR